jgi:uncharacterized membrane protein YccC
MSMSAGVYSLRSQLLSTLTRVKRPNVPVAVALRNTAAVVLPLAVGFATGVPGVGVGISVGALTTMFADQPGPYRQRLELIALVSLAGAVSGLTGFLVGAHLPLRLAAVAVWGFACGLMVLYGPRMTRVGVTSMILLIVATATPRPWFEALEAAGLILAGGLLQLLFSIAAWPLMRYRPERQAVATVYQELAQLARRDPGAGDAPPVSESLLELQRTLLGHSHARGRAMEAFYTLMELAERIRLELLAGQLFAIEASTRRIRARQVARVLRASLAPLPMPARQRTPSMRWCACNAHSPTRATARRQACRRWPDSSPPRCATAIGPEAAVNCVPAMPRSVCRARCAAAHRWRHYAPICASPRQPSAMACVAPWSSPWPWRWPTTAISPTGTGCP